MDALEVRRSRHCTARGSRLRALEVAMQQAYVRHGLLRECDNGNGFVNRHTGE